MIPVSKNIAAVITSLLEAGYTLHNAEDVISVLRNGGLSIIETPQRLKKVNAPGWWWVRYCQLPAAIIQEITREPSGFLDHIPLFGDLDDIDWVEPVVPPTETP